MRAKLTVPIIALVIVIGAALVLQSAYIINERQQAIVLQFGEHVRTVNEPGLYFKIPFIQDVLFFESRILMADTGAAEYITHDKKKLLVDHISRWRIVDPLAFYQAVRSESIALARLADIVDSKLRQEIANHDFAEIIREKREQIMEKVTNESKPLAAQFGIDVLDVRIKRIDLPREVQESVFSRMEAERHRIALRYRAEGSEAAQEIRAAADKEREIILATAYEQAERIRGEGDARAARIYADAFGQDPEFYNFRRRLETYEKVIGEGTTLLMDINSDLLRYLEGSYGK